jgi:hypothetical protein
VVQSASGSTGRRHLDRTAIYRAFIRQLVLVVFTLKKCKLLPK